MAETACAPDTWLNVAAIRTGSRVNGPGLRAAVWVQGCTVGCPGCFNPHTHPHQRRRLVDPQALGHALCTREVDGLTLSGGEPFEQARACALLAETVRAGGRSVLVFSGYPLAVLSRSPEPAVRRLLDAIDLLIAGPYVARLAQAPQHWLASRNQRPHALSPRGQDLLDRYEPTAPVVEASLDGTQLSWSGFPSEEDQRWLDALLRPADDPEPD